MSNSYPHYINHSPSLLSVNRPYHPLCPMEFSSYNIKPTISLSSFYLILLSFATIPETHVTGSKACNFPAIFNFGDSNSDTGGYSTSYYRARPPYGKTYFHMPVGRYSDGRLMIDFMANKVGLPYLSAFLDSLGSNFTHGANFAYSASPITPQTRGLPQGGFSPFYLDVQHRQFMQFKDRSQFLRKHGDVFKRLMPPKEYFTRALYTFDIGQNDLGAGFFGNKSIAEVNASVPTILSRFSTDVKNIYNLGARSFWIHNTGPIGCLSYILANFPIRSDQMDGSGCSKQHNDVCQYFNHKLREAVLQLRKDLPLAAITYVDIYTAKYSMFSQPRKYGFEQPLITCCGYGGKYNFNSSYGCGETISVDNRTFIVGSCKNPSVKVIWDGIHYTEAANKFVFDQLSTGRLSDPPIPLESACHRVLS